MMLAHAAHAADASALFAEGERAFAVGEYGEALRLFEAARLAGSTGPSVQYNIGVCEYRLRNYDAAEATFAELATSFPALRELAEYNKGLALRAGGRPAEARSAFARASGSTDDKIAALANAQLAELGSPAPIAASRWRGYVSGGIGHDDLHRCPGPLQVPHQLRCLVGGDAAADPEQQLAAGKPVAVGKRGGIVHCA